MGISELEKYKAEADAILMEARWQSVQYCFVEFDTVLPLVTAFAIQQEHDWQGVRLQHLGDLTRNLDVVSVTVTSYNGASWAIFAWPQESKTAERFVESFLSIERAEMAERLVAACFDLAENNYLDPLWWHAISDTSRKSLGSQILSGIEGLHTSDGMQRRAELTRPAMPTDVVRSQS